MQVWERLGFESSDSDSRSFWVHQKLDFRFPLVQVFAEKSSSGVRVGFFTGPSQTHYITRAYK